jgi:hypothetical protein
MNGTKGWAPQEAISAGRPYVGEGDVREQAYQLLFSEMPLDYLMKQYNGMTKSQLEAEQEKIEDELRTIKNQLAGEIGEGAGALIQRQADLTRRIGVIEAIINDRSHPNCR